MFAKSLITLSVPLIGSLITSIGLPSRAFSKYTIGYSALFLSFLGVFSAISLNVAFFYDQKPVIYTLFSFINIPGDKNNVLYWAISVDGLSTVMALIVHIVSFCVVAFSIKYMDEEKRYNRYFTYLSLFTFLMLVLTFSDNFIQFFIGWEGVGLCSYLLIGYWYEKKSANAAAYKAFIVNRVGDIGLICAILILYHFSGSFNFNAINNSLISPIPELAFFFGKVNILTLVAILALVGAMTKSAQILFHVWLPDAMEGPTPVSALIHAATMVTAGVILLIRLAFLLDNTIHILPIIALIGAITALLMAFIAINQNDIKKIIAYSTCSQLGLMFIAIGTSSYSVSFFHLATHAFFKALLFLGAGALIYALHHEQSIYKMNTSWKKMPITLILMLIGCFSLSGIRPLSGYYSKDAIIESVFTVLQTPLRDFDLYLYNITFYLALIVALVGGIYSIRPILHIYWPRNKKDKASISASLHNNSHHLPPAYSHGYSMKAEPVMHMIPLIILGIFSIAGGIIANKYFHFVASQNNYLSSLLPATSIKMMENIHHTPFIFKIILQGLPVAGITIYCIYYFFSKPIQNILLIRPFVNKLWFDEIYNFTFVKLYNFIARAFYLIDYYVINGTIRGLVFSCQRFSVLTNALQTGKIQQYLFFIIAALILFLLIVIVVLFNVL